MPQPLFQTRKSFEHSLVGPIVLTLRASTCRHSQILDHTQIAKNAAAFWHVGNAKLRHFKNIAAIHALTFDVHIARLRFDNAHDGFEQCTFAHAIATHQANGFAAIHFEVNVAQNVAGPVETVETLHLNQCVAHFIHPHPNRRLERLHRRAPQQAIRWRSLGH